MLNSSDLEKHWNNMLSTFGVKYFYKNKSYFGHLEYSPVEIENETDSYFLSTIPRLTTHENVKKMEIGDNIIIKKEEFTIRNVTDKCSFDTRVYELDKKRD